MDLFTFFTIFLLHSPIFKSTFKAVCDCDMANFPLRKADLEKAKVSAMARRPVSLSQHPASSDPYHVQMMIGLIYTPGFGGNFGEEYTKM